MARIAVEALHGVGDQEIEEGPGIGLALDVMEQVELGSGGQGGEGASGEMQAGAVDGGDAHAVGWLERLIEEGQLAIDEDDDAGLDGTGVLVLGDDVGADGLEGEGFGQGEEAPGTFGTGAAYGGCGEARGDEAPATHARNRVAGIGGDFKLIGF